MKLWLDDLRPAPAGWTLARTATEAIEYLKTGHVSVESLDHDLGGGAFVHNGPDGMSGMSVINFLEEQSELRKRNLWPPRVIVHSHNEHCAEIMVRTAQRYTRAIYVKFTGKEI